MARPGAGARDRRAKSVTARAPTQRQDEAWTAQDGPVDGQDVQADREREEQRQRVVAHREPERHRRRQQVAVGGRLARRGPGPPRRRAGAGGSATSARCSACGSACVPIAQTIGVSARPSPAATPRATDRVSARTRSTVTAGGDADADGREERSSGTRGRRRAGARPTRASRAARTSGKPVGWAVPISGPTAWNSAVSQNPTPGMQREPRRGERQDADRDGRRQVRGVRSATLCYAQIHLPRSCRSRSR